MTRESSLLLSLFRVFEPTRRIHRTCPREEQQTHQQAPKNEVLDDLTQQNNALKHHILPTIDNHKRMSIFDI
jgi:hypothetical protein